MLLAIFLEGLTTVHWKGRGDGWAPCKGEMPACLPLKKKPIPYHVTRKKQTFEWLSGLLINQRLFIVLSLISDEMEYIIEYNWFLLKSSLELSLIENVSEPVILPEWCRHPSGQPVTGCIIPFVWCFTFRVWRLTPKCRNPFQKKLCSECLSNLQSRAEYMWNMFWTQVISSLWNVSTSIW